MDRSYYVVGGEYADTSFTTIAEGRPEERHGPFSEKDAHDFWRAITGKTVDNAMIRYFIKPDEAVAGRVFYVTGGEYADATFTRIDHPETYGPFTRAEAMDHWRAVTGRTVDNALVRYDIASGDEVKRAG